MERVCALREWQRHKLMAGLRQAEELRQHAKPKGKVPKKEAKKVEEVEAAEEVANQVTFDTGSAGPEQCAPRPASHALAHARGPTAHQQKQLEDAMLQHAVAARVAKGVRQKAKEQEAQCLLSLRLHDAKMRRLDIMTLTTERGANVAAAP